MPPRQPRLALTVLGTLFAATLLAGAAVAASISAPNAPAAVKARQAHMKSLGAATKALGEQLRSGAPDKAVVKAQADKIAAGAHALPGWFSAGSGPGPGIKTDARPIVWTDPAGFATAGDKLVKAAAILSAAAATPDQAGVPAAAKGLIGACKGCHEKYRVPDKS